MKNHQPTYFSGQGKCFIGQWVRGEKINERFVGNVPELSLKTSVSKKEHKESHSGFRTVDKIILTDKQVEVNFAIEEFTLENLALAFHGKIKEVAEKTITKELSGEIGKGDNWALAHQKVSDVVIVDNQDQPLVENTDYIVNADFGRITIITESQTLKAPFKASYTAGKVKKVEFLQQSNPEYYLRFEGLNTADDNRPVLVEIPKIAFDPASNFDLINDDLNSFSLSGQALDVGANPVSITML